MMKRAQKNEAPRACLTVEQIDRFYFIYRRLLRYANRRRQIVDGFLEENINSSMSMMDAHAIREVLWKDDSLLDDFVRDNPEQLSPQDLAIVESWKQRVTGDFYIVRALKEHAILLAARNDGLVYGVKGLLDPLDVVCNQPLPCLIHAVLLPFEDSITYDGLLSGYSVSFGPGIRGSLEQAYRDAYERGEIITSLQPREIDPDEQKAYVRKVHARILDEFRRELSASSLSMKVIERDIKNAGRLLDHLSSLTPPRTVHQLSQQDIEADLQLANTFMLKAEYKQTLTSFKRFVKFLRDSGRVDWQPAEEMLDMLKMLSG
jgi:hypothetical protein